MSDNETISGAQGQQTGAAISEENGLNQSGGLIGGASVGVATHGFVGSSDLESQAETVPGADSPEAETGKDGDPHASVISENLNNGAANG